MEENLMPFNPFVWNNTQPSPQQFISTGQTTILNNFQFLGSLTGVSTPGFIQFPNGLIMQWGELTGILVGNGAGTNTVTFPTAFPNNCFAAYISEVKSSTTSTNILHISVEPTTVSFLIIGQGGATPNFPTKAFWLAIGN
jgi:tail fiber protein gp53